MRAARYQYDTQEAQYQLRIISSSFIGFSIFKPIAILMHCKLNDSQINQAAPRERERAGFVSAFVCLFVCLLLVA